MKNTLKIIVLLVITAGLTLCIEDKEPVEFSIDKSDFQINATGDTLQVVISSNTTWSVNDTSNGVTITPEEGNGNDTITLVISENLLEENRTTNVIFFADNKEVSLSITQLSKEKEVPVPFLHVSADSLFFTDKGGENTITIETNYIWSVDWDASWLTMISPTDTVNGAIFITAKANEGDTDRQTIVTITAGDIKKEIVIIQEAWVITYDIPPDNSDIRDINSVDFAKQFGAGWNIGNSLEAIGGETNWGNPKISQRLIDSVKAAGFNFIRLPVAWSKFSDNTNYTIENSWFNRVEEVVNYILNNDMYVMINIHWDGGWMQPTYADQEYVNNRLEIMWKQIATHFRDYDDHVLFAGTNEVMVEGNYGTPTKEYYTVQNGFNQVFVNAVRSTGGRNAYRHLIVQGFNTNINNAVNFAVMPTDVVENRLMMEVHYYDPYNYALNENSTVWQWGKIATNSAYTETWANESYVDSQFDKMKTNFIDNGIAVIMGEYGAIAKMDYTGYEVYRQYYMEYITQAMADRGIVPVYWDNGYPENKQFGLFNRSTGAQAFPEIIEAIVKPFQ